MCKSGQRLDPNQAALLRVFGVKMARCQLKLLGCWAAAQEAYTPLVEEGEGGSEEEEGAELLDAPADFDDGLDFGAAPAISDADFDA